MVNCVTLGTQVFSLSHARDMLINSFSHNFVFFQKENLNPLAFLITLLGK